MRSTKTILASLAALPVLTIAAVPAVAHPVHHKPHRVCEVRHHGFLGHKKVRICHWVR